ncbi:hypothetical protein DH2020_044561 [Rehmannia glutinosa]|uniref:ADP-ribosylation factor-related protein 1 n=1 Tax=Rehmannia glutinosa TaxID=99300 RepID=A0ABR0UGJ8_REHGL
MYQIGCFMKDYLFQQSFVVKNRLQLQLSVSQKSCHFRSIEAVLISFLAFLKLLKYFNIIGEIKVTVLKRGRPPPDRIVPTVGLNIGRVEVSNTKLVFWDLGGQPGLRSIWEKYYEEAHAVIYVIDAACPSRFEDSKSALEKVLRHEDLQGAPLLILANKQDLEDAVSADELAQYLDLKKLDERVYTFQAVSSFDGLGIKESVNWLVDAMERSKRTDMLRVRAGSSVV